jgi:hypothetical protein
MAHSIKLNLCFLTLSVLAGATSGLLIGSGKIQDFASLPKNLNIGIPIIHGLMIFIASLILLKALELIGRFIYKIFQYKSIEYEIIKINAKEDGPLGSKTNRKIMHDLPGFCELKEVGSIKYMKGILENTSGKLNILKKQFNVAEPITKSKEVEKSNEIKTNSSNTIKHEDFINPENWTVNKYYLLQKTNIPGHETILIGIKHGLKYNDCDKIIDPDLLSNSQNQSVLIDLKHTKDNYSVDKHEHNTLEKENTYEVKVALPLKKLVFMALKDAFCELNQLKNNDKLKSE